MTVSLEVLLAGAALVISIIALWYTALTFWLKKGARLRGSFTITSSISCEDKYVSSVTIQNQKDRAVVIFKVFLYIRHGYYIELDDFESTPLILGPFEVWHRDYEPIEMYTESTDRVDLNGFLAKAYKGMRLVLATSEGPYIVKKWLKQWDPLYHVFRNHAISVIQTRRSTFEGKSYGSNAKYVVKFRLADGKEEAVPIYDRDYTIRKFRGFRLTQESLQSKGALEEYLLQQAVAGLLPCRDLTVFDLETWRQEAYDTERKRPKIVAQPQSWIVYRILGPIITRWRMHQERRENQALRKKQQLAAVAAAEEARQSSAVKLPPTAPPAEQRREVPVDGTR